MRFWKNLSSMTLAICLSVSGILNGQEETPQAEPPLKVVTLLNGINQPFSLAIHPQTQDVFVAETGLQKVFRLADGKKKDVVIDLPDGKFKIADANPDLEFIGGPTAIAFGIDGHLYVATSGLGEEADTIYRFRLTDPPKEDAKPDENAQKNANKKQAIQRIVKRPVQGPSKKPDSKQKKIVIDFRLRKASEAIATAQLKKKSNAPGGAGFLDLIVDSKFVYSGSLFSEVEKGWVFRGSIKKDKITLVRRFAEAATLLKSKNVSALGIGAGGEIVAGCMGEAGKVDSKLIFVDAKDGAAMVDFSLSDIKDIIDISFSPDGRKLFVLDHDFSDPESGGIFQLTAKQDGSGCEVKKVIDLASPTAMAFNSKGELFVTLAGYPKKGQEWQGKLIRIDGLLAKPESKK